MWPQPCQKYIRGTTGALEGDSVVKTVAMETQHWWNVENRFLFLYCIFSSSIFIPSLVPSQSKKLPPGRQRGCVRQKHVFAFLSLSLLNPTQPNPTPSRRWDAAAKMGFHSFIFRIIVRLFADFTFTADNGGGFVCGSACSTHDKNFTLCHLPSCLHKCTRTCLHTVGC